MKGAMLPADELMRALREHAASAPPVLHADGMLEQVVSCADSGETVCVRIGGQRVAGTRTRVNGADLVPAEFSEGAVTCSEPECPYCFF